jgi:hypothetical protein
MTKATVEQILGIPKQHGRVTTNVADGVLIQHTYQGNPSIWYGRLEHYIRVSYLDGRAVEVKRFGL